MPWLIDVAVGLLVAAALYWLVRVRMVLAPYLRGRLGQWARWTTWIIVWGLMIAVANAALIGLRSLHGDSDATGALLHEIVYAIVACGLGFYLVVRFVSRNREKQIKEKEL